MVGLSQQRVFGTHPTNFSFCSMLIFPEVCFANASMINIYNAVLTKKNIIPGGPIKTEQSIQSIFQNFALINSYLFHLAG